MTAPQNFLKTKLIITNAALLLILAPACLVAGLILDLKLFPSPLTAAQGWYLYALPFSAAGALFVGAIQGLILCYCLRPGKHPYLWSLLGILILLGSFANGMFSVKMVMGLTLIANLLVVLLLKRLFFNSYFRGLC